MLRQKHTHQHTQPGMTKQEIGTKSKFIPSKPTQIRAQMVQGELVWLFLWDIYVFKQL